MSLAKSTKQNSSEEVNKNKDIRVSVIRGRKITITTTSAILAGGKLSTASAKITSLKGGQDVRVKKV